MNELNSPTFIKVQDYGAIADGKHLADGNITTGTNILTSAAGGFAASDVGKSIAISGAGAGGGRLYTIISGYTSTNQVTLAANASSTATNRNVFWGTDNAASLQSALNIFQKYGGTLIFNPGMYMTSVGLTLNTSLGGTILASGAILKPLRDSITLLSLVNTSVYPNPSLDIFGFSISGSSYTGVNGIDITDSTNIHLYNTNISVCPGFGLRFRNVNAGKYNELHTTFNVKIADCGKGIIFKKESAADVSFNQICLLNTNVTTCVTAVEVNTLCDMTRVYFQNLTLWVNANQTGLHINGNISGVRWNVAFESFSNIGSTAVELGPNITYYNFSTFQTYPIYDIEFTFSGGHTFATLIKNTGNITNFVWRNGNIIHGLPTTEVIDGAIQNNQYISWLDTDSNLLKFKVRDGSGNIKRGSIPLS